MKKKLFSILLAVIMIQASLCAAHVSFHAAESDDTVGQSQFAQDSIRGAAVLHCFNWTYNEIKANLPDIAKAGYTAVQTSPVQKPKSFKAGTTSTSDLWWKLYQPLTLSVPDDNPLLGTKSELKSMCAEAEKYNIKVIVDIVANHMANSKSGGTFSKLNSEVESDLQKAEYYHSESYGANDNSRYEMTHGHIGMPDLNTANSHVQHRVLGLLKECVDCGVDGFRFDAAKHIELPSDDSNTRSDFWKYVTDGIKAYKSDVFCYGEILNTAATSMSNYTKYIAVTDNKTGNSALSAAKNSNASKLAASNYQMGAGASNSVIWAESHDTYMHDETSGISDSVINKAWAISGARAKSTSLYFARPNSVMGKASTDTNWKSATITEINKFKNYFMGQSESLASSDKTAYIERGTTGVCIAKLDGAGDVSLTANKMASGTYKDQITGNTFTVSGGKIKGTVGSKGVAVVYNPENVPTTTATTTTAPVTTAAPTTAKPTTVPVTTAAPATAKPTTVPVTTAAPTTAKPTTVPVTTVMPTTVSVTTAEPTTAPVARVRIGDVNGDGAISIADVTAIQMYLAELITYPHIEITGDVNGDGELEISDATLIQMYLSEFEFPSLIGQYKTLDPEQPTTQAAAETTVQPTTIQPTTVQATTVQPTTVQDTTAPQEYTLYFTNSRGWSGSIYCYYWAKGNTHMLSWPGQKMTYDRTNSSNQKIYRITVPADIDYVIFNNNSSQTVNIPFDGTKLRFYAKSSTDSNGKYEYGTW